LNTYDSICRVCGKDLRPKTDEKGRAVYPAHYVMMQKEEIIGAACSKACVETFVRSGHQVTEYLIPERIEHYYAIRKDR